MMSIESNPSNMAGIATQFPPVTYSSSFVSYLIQVNINVFHLILQLRANRLDYHILQQLFALLISYDPTLRPLFKFN